MMRIAIGIPTYRRPERLEELIAALPARIAEVDTPIEAIVIVVDNDPSGSASDVIARAAVPMRSAVEPLPGIAAVRNLLLDLSADCDALVFIDDDELPLPGWLDALVATWERTRPAAVMGRVVSIFAEPVDPWVLETGVFQRRSRPTGLELTTAASGNLLLDLAQVRSAGVRFDSSIGLAGGEDTLFSRQLVAAGGRIVWCDESQAQDTVPRERTTRSWAMRRAFNGGNSAVHVDLSLSGSPAGRAAVRARRLLGGSARVVTGSARHVLGVLIGDLTADARGLRTAHRGKGMVAAALGHRHQEYGRSDD